ncbi:putative glutamate--cysteine ligase 2 [Paractinoplanes abujensis]|uniref:Putative glutamate--cysteine ligase 2 n=1 Tax=Paractinoplanes abujensis TaxID=882441 RepID=A0A7W7CS91_9ACTN|nr:glutamate--cysteine ligase [Actinoplanes abujensis]MBB4693737.1 carboxylate-amine ligase [Actinoplanes abujensis]GID21606.1 putative glutamate--cysteine ligase 2 [Actinoplanes abujensis]
MTLTLGVEEEFLLLDPHTGENAPLAEKVAAELPADLRRRYRREFRPSMVELVTDVCTGLGELREQLLTARRTTAGLATAAGASLAAVGATPVAESQREPADDTRFRKIVDHYGPIARDPAVCGCHVHVGIPTVELAVEVCTRLRGSLPMLQALAANSPRCEGADTGYASWRSIQLERWPSMGPWPHVRSVADYDRIIRTLIASGEMMDESMIFYYSRPSANFPTVEIRVADVCLTADDTVLVAALARGLIGAAIADAEAGRPAPEIPDVVLHGAHWNAARDGLGGTLLDPVAGQARPAWDMIGDLLDRVAPVLREHGDLTFVEAGLDRVRREGTGADRQRRWPATELTDQLARATVSGQDRP